MLRKIVLFHERTGPDGFENLFLGQNPSWIPGQAAEHFKCLGQQRDRSAIAQQSTPGTAQLEFIEPVAVMRKRGHCAPS
jgi:hypothetical protein